MRKLILFLILVLTVISSVDAQYRFDVTIKDTIKYKEPYLQVRIANNTDIPAIIYNEIKVIGYDQIIDGPYTYMQVIGNPGEKDCYTTGRILFKDTDIDRKKHHIPFRAHTELYEEFPFLGTYSVWENPFPEDADKKIRTLQLKLIIKYFDGKAEKFINDTIYSNIIPWTAKP